MSFLPSLLSAPQAPEPLLIDIDHTLFVQLGLFLLVVIVLQRFLWKPYLRIREERVTRIDGFRDQAARIEADAVARLARTEGQLEEARRIGAGERAVARAEARAREQTLLAEAQAAAQRTLAEARAKLDTTLAVERTKLQAKADEIGREAARKILGREVSA
jgi:F-type H+-transporting ATPase subunit b